MLYLSVWPLVGFYESDTTGWESLLLECGFLAIFLGPTDVEPAAAIVWLYRWVLFRVMFGAGLIQDAG